MNLYRARRISKQATMVGMVGTAMSEGAEGEHSECSMEEGAGFSEVQACCLLYSSWPQERR